MQNKCKDFNLLNLEFLHFQMKMLDRAMCFYGYHILDCLRYGSYDNV